MHLLEVFQDAGMGWDSIMKLLLTLSTFGQQRTAHMCKYSFLVVRVHYSTEPVPVLHSTVQYLQYSTVQNDVTVQYSTVQNDVTLQYSTVQAHTEYSLTQYYRIE